MIELMRKKYLIMEMMNNQNEKENVQDKLVNGKKIERNSMQLMYTFFKFKNVV